MKYKTLFRVLLKVLGVYFVVSGMSGCVVTLAALVRPSTPLAWDVLMATSGLMQVAVGLYLFFGAKWVVDKAIPGNRPYCQECGYDLTGAVEDRCTECGTPFKRDDVRPATPDEPKIM